MIEIAKSLPVWPFIILSALFAGLISVYINRKSRFNDAAKKFRGAFNEELTALESRKNEEINVRKLLLRAFDKHSAAVTEFRPHVGFLYKRGFNKAWEQYYYGQNIDPEAWGFKGKDSILLQYLSVNETEEQSVRDLAIINIHWLLRYAK